MSGVRLPEDVASAVRVDEGLGPRNLEAAGMGPEVDAAGPLAVGNLPFVGIASVGIVPQGSRRCRCW